MKMPHDVLFYVLCGISAIEVSSYRKTNEYLRSNI